MFAKLKTILEEGNGGLLRYGEIAIYNNDKTFHVIIEGEMEEIRLFIHGKMENKFNFEEGDYPDAEFMEILKKIQQKVQPFIDTQFMIEGLCDSNICDTSEWVQTVLTDSIVKFLTDYCKIPEKNISYFVTQ